MPMITRGIGFNSTYGLAGRRRFIVILSLLYCTIPNPWSIEHDPRQFVINLNHRYDVGNVETWKRDKSGKAEYGLN